MREITRSIGPRRALFYMPELCEGCKLSKPKQDDYIPYICFFIKYKYNNLETCPCQECIVRMICCQVCQPKRDWEFIKLKKPK
jgi:hypothetical protein